MVTARQLAIYYNKSFVKTGRLFVEEIINVRAELINVSVVRRHTRMMYNVNVEA